MASLTSTSYNPATKLYKVTLRKPDRPAKTEYTHDRAEARKMTERHRKSIR